MEDYKKKLGSLAAKLKTETPQTPIQHVQPVKAPPPETETEVQFNNWIPASLKKQVRQYAVDHDISIKDINIEALQLYLKTKNKPLTAG